jgi:hypothetical protein
MRSAGVLVPLALSLGGCALFSSTHPRFSPIATRRWPEVDRVVVLPARLEIETKNLAVDDFLPTAPAGPAMLFGDATRRAIENSGREPLYDFQRDDALHGDRARAAATADLLLAHVRSRMGLDPEYDDRVIHGLEIDPETIPSELKRAGDAIAVIGGRLKIETQKDFFWRWTRIAIAAVVTYPIQLLGVAFPFLLPFTTKINIRFFEPTPERAYVFVGVFDAQTGKLLFLNDWAGRRAPDDQVDWKNLAEKLLDPLLDVKGDPTAPLGSPP